MAMSADKSGTPSEQRRAKVNWKPGRERTREERENSRCELCVWREVLGSQCQNPLLKCATQLTAVCDHYRVKLT